MKFRWNHNYTLTYKLYTKKKSSVFGCHLKRISKLRNYTQKISDSFEFLSAFAFLSFLVVIFQICMHFYVVEIFFVQTHNITQEKFDETNELFVNTISNTEIRPIISIFNRIVDDQQRLNYQTVELIKRYEEKLTIRRPLFAIDMLNKWGADFN